MKKFYLFCFLISFFCYSKSFAQFKEEVDIVIYGGSSAGIAAAIQSSRMGKRVIVIEPSNHLGGLTTGGLGQTDIGNKQVIGGISREFYQRIRKYYDESNNWSWQNRDEYLDEGQSRTSKGEDAMWTFEPSAALHVYKKMLEEENIEVIFNERLNRKTGVLKRDGSIISIEMESGSSFSGKVFIDATYEGDLMAAAGVSYAVGREDNDTYGETLNGYYMADYHKQSGYHQFPDGVDPFITPGDPSSGLLWGISTRTTSYEGKGDDLVQAYNFRICLTDHPDNQVPIEKPKDYDPSKYELLVRLFEAQPEMRKINHYFIWSPMPNRKTDINNRGGFSTDAIGMNHDWPEASYEMREVIWKSHYDYTIGLLYFYQNDPRVPKELQDFAKDWGLPKDEFIESGNFSPQLYIREGRRMISDYVMTQHHCQGNQVVTDPVGMAAYTMDSHNTQRIVVDGMVKNEGNVEVGGFTPYPISYRSIVPKKKECNNLLVPIALSASHIAFGSIRMEPVFMILGQSAATAAVLSIDGNYKVQDLPYSRLKAKLVRDKQILSN